VNEELDRAIDGWARWFGRRDEVARAVLPGVERWEWSTGARYSVLPLHWERYPGRGRPLTEPPAQRSQHHENGLAADGRLLVERVFDHRDEAFETFVLHGDPVTDVVGFGPPPHIPIEHALVERRDGRVVRHASFRLNGYTPKYAQMATSPARLVDWLGPNGRFLLVEEYRYDGPTLREIVAHGESPGAGPHRYVDRVGYGDDGAVAAIDRTWADGTVQVVYRRRRKGQSMTTLREAAVAELVGTLPGIVAAARIRDRAYCIELGYRNVEQYFPPLVTVGLERDRLSARDPSVVYRPLLNGGRTIDFPDPDALAACRQFDQEVLSSSRWELGGRMLGEAAAELTRRDWTGALDVTDDFVVFAIDPMMDDLEEALAKSAPTDRIASWRDAGWLPG